MSVIVEIEASFAGDAGEDVGEVENYLDAVMEELVELNFGDPMFEVDLAKQKALLTLVFEPAGKTDAECVEHALTVFRTAVHAAGGATHDWPTGSDVQRQIAQSSFTMEIATAELV